MQSEQNGEISSRRSQKLLRRGLGLLLMLIVVLPLAYCGITDALNYRGICVKELRRISDRELIQPWVEGAIRNYPPLDPRGTKDESGKWQSVIAGLGTPIPYHDAAELLKLNPGCCTVEDFDPSSGYVLGSEEKRAGLGRGFVRLEYDIRYRVADGSEASKKYLTASAVTNCGDLWRPY